MEQDIGKRIGEVKIKTYILKNDNTLLKLDKATVITCSLSKDEMQSRACTELGKPEGRSCEELILVFRSSGCVKEAQEVDLDEVITVAKEILTT